MGFGAAFCYHYIYRHIPSFLISWLLLEFLYGMAVCLFWGCRMQGNILVKKVFVQGSGYIIRAKFLSYAHFSCGFGYSGRSHIYRPSLESHLFTCGCVCYHSPGGPFFTFSVGSLMAELYGMGAGRYISFWQPLLDLTFRVEGMDGHGNS